MQGLQKYTRFECRGKVYVARKLEMLAYDHIEWREILQLEKNTVFSEQIIMTSDLRCFTHKTECLNITCAHHLSPLN